MPDQPAPTLSVVIPTRRGYARVGPILERFAEPVAAVDGEVVVIDGSGDTPDVPDWVRWIPTEETDWLRLTDVAIRAARGDVIVIGEDHTFPSPDFCEAVLRAHAEHLDADLVAGCLVNGAEDTVTGRANFLVVGPPYVPGIRELPPERPPPTSVMSFKRRLISVLDGPGSLETSIAPRLFVERRIAVDDRIVAEHDQDLGFFGTMHNRYKASRAMYGYARPSDRAHRREVIRWVIKRGPGVVLRPARAAAGTGLRARVDLLAAAAFAASAAVGGTVGTLFGPGKAANQFY
jgi:hypothetical protein